MKQIMIAFVCALMLSGCGEVRDRTGEMFQRGQVYAQRIGVIFFGQNGAESQSGAAVPGAARALAPGEAAPANAPMLPARPGFGADGWFIWAGWRYHQSGLVCPPRLEGFTFSRVSAVEAPVLAACSYYGPEFQVLHITQAEDAGAAGQAFEARLSGAGTPVSQGEDGALTAVRGSQTLSLQTFPAHHQGVLTLECEYESPRHDALIAKTVAAARKAQLAFDKRDRLSGAT